MNKRPCFKIYFSVKHNEYDEFLEHLKKKIFLKVILWGMSNSITCFSHKNYW